jgi:hypothetical protein
MRAARATALVGLPLLLVAGCGSIDLPALKPASSAKAMKAGTFTKVVGGVAAETLAEDCVSVVAQLFAPGSTYLVFHQGAESELGAEIEQRFRERGYSVDSGYRKQEEVPENAAFVRFVADEFGGLVRLTVVVWGGENKEYTVLNRGYVIRRAEVIPAGAWTKKG